MTWGAGFYVLFHLLAVAVVATLGVYAARNRQTPGSRSLALLLFAASGWAAGYALLLSTQDVATKLLFSRLTFVAIAFVPVSWFSFALRYTGSRRLAPRGLLPALAVTSAAFAVAGLTNPAHGLVWQAFDTTASGTFSLRVEAYGPIYNIYLAYSYALLAGGAGLVVRMLAVRDSIHRGQAAALLVAISAPFAANVLYFLGVTEPGFDPTAMAAIVSGVVLWLSVSRYQLLTLSPATRDVTRDEFIDRMTDPVVALNEREQVVDANPAALELFGQPRETAVGSRLDAVVPDLASLLDRTVVGVTGRQVYTRHAEGVHHTYDVSVEPLSWDDDVVAGRLITLHDVTDRRRREEHLRVLHRLLRHNLRNDLNVIVGHAGDLNGRSDPAVVGSHTAVIERTASRLVSQADKLGRAIHEVEAEASYTVDVAELLAEVVGDARTTTRANVTLTVDRDAHVTAGPLLRLAFSELVENGVVHNDSAVPSVEVSVGPADDGSAIAVTVADDGPGIPEHEVEALQTGREEPLNHTTGVGLWVVSWAIRRYGGRFTFDADDTGTTVTVVLPRAACSAD